jgi:hypothetical protein
LILPGNRSFKGASLDALELFQSALIDHVAGIQGRSRFEEKDPAFFVGDGFVFRPARDDDELAFLDPFVAIEKFHAKSAFDNEKHFVFMLMVMEDELAFELVELHVLAVEFRGDVWLPVFGDSRELFGDVDLVHHDLEGKLLNTPIRWMDREQKSCAKIAVPHLGKRPSACAGGPLIELRIGLEPWRSAVRVAVVERYADAALRVDTGCGGPVDIVRADDTGASADQGVRDAAILIAITADG